LFLKQIYLPDFWFSSGSVQDGKGESKTMFFLRKYNELG